MGSIEKVASQEKSWYQGLSRGDWVLVTSWKVQVKRESRICEDEQKHDQCGKKVDCFRNSEDSSKECNDKA